MTESMQFDVVIVGAGPAGLSAAMRLRQIALKESREISVCVVEKGSEVGAHLLAGAVLEPTALNELIPDWKEKGAPLNTPVTEDKFLLLGGRGDQHFKLPIPPQMRNHGNYIIRLGNFCRWLAAQAESIGVQIFPGFPAADVLYNADGSVAGILTGEFGLGKDGARKESYQPPVEIRAKHTLFGEGCRGSLTGKLEKKFGLREGLSPQSYGIGIKELWRVKPEHHKPGLVTHTIGWPMDDKTYGGAFLYHLEDNQVSVGFVVGLDYRNPHLNPYQEFQRFKTHPAIRGVFEGGQRIAYGARALNEGGLQAIPTLAFPGGALIGCGAGFLNVPKIKGIHTAMKSGMVAAEAIMEGELAAYPEKLGRSWVYPELRRARNIRPAFRFGLFAGMLYAAFDTYILRGRAPWTFRPRIPDNAQLWQARYARPIDYPKPDGVITFDLMSSVFLSNTNHAEDQPCHLKLINPKLAIEVNHAVFASPETRYCPAGVYELVEGAKNEAGEQAPPTLRINAQNCLHCKTCDIKDPMQNITWVPPEGGGGPNYPGM